MKVELHVFSISEQASSACFGHLCRCRFFGWLGDLDTCRVGSLRTGGSMYPPHTPHPPTNMILKIRHALYKRGKLFINVKCSPQRTWNGNIYVPLSAFHQARLLSLRNDSEDCITRLNQKRVLGSEVALWHLANRLVYLDGVPIFLLQKWLLLSQRVNCLQLYPTTQSALQTISSAMIRIIMLSDL